MAIIIILRKIPETSPRRPSGEGCATSYVPHLQMTSVGSQSTSERERETEGKNIIKGKGSSPVLTYSKALRVL
jgi:hypothetical protein